MNDVLSVKSLVTSLSNGIRIVDELSLSIKTGETFALLGESGCGKSMTALSLLRLLPDGIANTSGEIVLQQQNLTALSERDMRRVRGGQVAMIFQEPALSLNPVLTVGQQLLEVLKLHQPIHATSPHCIALLEQVGIPDPARRVHEYPFQMSGGMKQRVMIAMALAGRPQLLVADEPTTALDVTIQAQVLQLLREQQQHNGMAMLLITHDLGVVAEMAHQVGVMYAGQIIEQGSREQLFARPLHPYTQKLFAALPDINRRGATLSAIAGHVPALGTVQQGCRFAPRCDAAWDLCREQVPQWCTVESGAGVRCHLYNRAWQQQNVAQVPVAVGAEQMVKPETLVPVLQVSDLCVHFPIRKGVLQRVVGHVKAVDGVSLNITPGKTLALVGESGCGKTTLGKALLQLYKPSAGGVKFMGQELVGLSAAALRQGRAGMQMVFQDPYSSLNPKMRVAEILEEGMAALNIGVSVAERQQRIDALLEQVGLSSQSKWRYPHEFSGGQRQRIAIARALAVEPKLLICDEPTSALDVSVQAQILNLLKELQQKLQLSYLFITHNLAVVAYLADEVCVMYLGRVVERGTVGEILNAPRHPYTQALLSAVPKLDGQGKERIKLVGDMPSPANPPVGCHFAPRCVLAQEKCRETYPQTRQLTATHGVCCHVVVG